MKWKVPRTWFFSVVFSLVLSASWVGGIANAQQFYPEATTLYFDASTTQRIWTILPTSTRTILGLSIMADLSNRTEIYCGNSTEIFDTWGNQSISFVALQNVCHDAIRFEKDGSSGVAVNITYLDGYIASSSIYSTDGLYNGPNFQEWLFVACVFLFFLSLSSWRRILSPFLNRVQ